MKQIFVDQLVRDQEGIEFFLMTSVQVRKTKRDKPYLSMQLDDKSGAISTKMWDIPADLAVEDLKDNTFVKVKFQVGEYQDQLQLTVFQLRPALPTEYEAGDFFRRSVQEPKEMWDELIALLDSKMSRGRTKDVVFKLLYENMQNYMTCPAGKTVHHCFIGGLLEHVLSMCKVAVPICQHYGIDQTLVLAACALHDIGKLRELSYDLGIGYTTEGTLIGHISIGMEMICEAAREYDDFSPRQRMELLHLIASHHGRLEYGSPKIPLSREAIIFNHIDGMDSKMGLCTEIERTGRPEDEMTPWSTHLGGPMYRGLGG